MRILGFGTYDRTTHPRCGILLDGFRDLGDDVAELDRPLGFSTAERVAMLGRPWLVHRLLGRLTLRWASLVVGRARLGPTPDAVVVGYLGHLDVLLARLLFPRTVVVLDLLVFAADTASDRGVRGGPKLLALGALDRLAIRCADLVLLDTAEHAAMLPGVHRHKGVVVPVGAPPQWFGPAPDSRAAGDPLAIVFYGLFTPLQGAPVIGRALALLARRDTPVRVTMVGTGQDLDRTRAAAVPAAHLVTWRDWLEPEALAELVRTHDVCLGIFADQGKGLRVTPNKVYQGAAAGCAIVTSDTAPQRRSLEDAACFVPPGDADALAGILESLAGDPARVLDLRRRAHDLAVARFAPRHVAGVARPALAAAIEEKHR